MGERSVLGGGLVGQTVAAAVLALLASCSLALPIDDLESASPTDGAPEAGADSAAADAGPSAPPEPRIVHYHFDGDVHDVSGNGRDGLLGGGANVSSPGVWGNALSCDGQGDLLAVSGDYRPGSRSFTVSTFFRVRVAGGRAAKELNTIFVKGSAWETSDNNAPGFGAGYNDGYQGTAPSVSAFVRDAATRVLVERVYDVATTPPPRDGSFHHLALVVDRGAALGSLYVDGDKVAESAIPGALGALDSSDPLRLCAEQSPAISLDGAIDEFVVIGRALSAAEVRSLAAHP